MTPRVRTLLLAAIALLAITTLRHAWVSDDAFISFRTIANFVDGRGLTWNPGHRVQTYTHPLWMLLLSGAHALTGELFYTSMAIGWVLTLAVAAIVAYGLAVSVEHGVFAVVLLALSPSFVDYTTSGLENPLTHLLLCGLALLYWKSEAPDETRLRHATLVAAFGALTRLDAILLFGPPVLWMAWQAYRGGLRPVRLVGSLALGALPLIAWELFSLVYYGFLIPNTAYAKLGTGIPRTDHLIQGFHYYVTQLRFDPLALAVAGAGLALPFAIRDRRLAPWALGVGAYLLYIVWIGGDFMAGRYFTAPMLMTLLMLCRTPLPRRPGAWAVAAGLAFVVAYSAKEPPFEYEGLERPGSHGPQGVADERSFYVRRSSLVTVGRDVLPTKGWAHQGLELRWDPQRVVIRGSVGLMGYYAGPTVHMIDIYGLADPLLARLPAIHDPQWRVGHYIREVPKGYKRTIETGTNHIADERLARYYEHLRTVTQGPLWSAERWTAIWNLHVGAYDHLIDREKYRYPDPVRIDQKELNAPPDEGGPEGGRSFKDVGIKVQLEGARSAGHVTVHVAGTAVYGVRFLHDGKPVGQRELPPHAGKAPHPIRVRVPEQAQHAGYDTVHVVPLRGSKGFSLHRLTVGP